jgi:hypothetical protein
MARGGGVNVRETTWKGDAGGCLGERFNQKRAYSACHRAGYYANATLSHGDPRPSLSGLCLRIILSVPAPPKSRLS